VDPVGMPFESACQATGFQIPQTNDSIFSAEANEVPVALKATALIGLLGPGNS